MSPSSSTRWCPTPEQVMILEELYRRGLRTPNSSQIQRITGNLSFYGKVQGKNVFYWFQNHKARDRQKLRKKMAKQQQMQLLHLYNPNLHLDQDSICHGINLQIPAGMFGVNKLSTNSTSPDHDLLLHHRHHYQIGGREELQEAAGRERQDQTASSLSAWMSSDLPKDHRTMNAIQVQVQSQVGSTTFPDWCRSSDQRPLQTLELFPLISPHATTAPKKTLNQEDASSSTHPLLSL